MRFKGKSDVEIYHLPDGEGIYKIIFITRAATVAFGRINNIYMKYDRARNTSRGVVRFTKPAESGN